MTTLYTVTVDTEEQWQWDQGWPTGRPQVSNVGQLPQFQERCQRYGAAVTYFANYAVWNCSESRKILLQLAERPQVEIGMHIHPWNTPPIIDYRKTAADESFLANLPEALIYAKLEAVYQKFLNHGLRPTSFRGGRYSSGAAVHRFLFERGFLADTSVVPFTTWRDRGAPDYRHRDVFPVRQASARFMKEALWEIPLTMGFSRQPFAFWQRMFEKIETGRLGRLHLIGIAERLNLVRRVWLNFEDPLGQHIVPFLKFLRRLRLPCICFTMHSSSLQVGANGCYTRCEQERTQLLERVENTLRLISSWPEFQAATVSEVAKHLEEEYNARSRN
jgi:hypothetical protein